MNLIIDVGNTRVKIGVYKNDKLLHNESVMLKYFEKTINFILKKYSCSNAIISSVGAIKKNQIDDLKSKICLIELNFDTKVPFLNHYATPKTLGVDRIALVSSAVSNFPKKNVLIIDAGTCITYDFVDSKTNYFGGAISPGIEMRYASLNYYTKKLPLLKPKYIQEIAGDSTENSIHMGVIQGVIGEIDNFVEHYRKKNEDLTVVLTGGDAIFLSNKLKNGIFANPFFLLDGLNSILTYNLS